MAVVILKIADKTLRLERGVFSDKLHVLMLGVVLKIGVQHVAPCGLHRVKKPAHMIIKKCKDLRDNTMEKQVLTDLFRSHELLQDQKMPLLVVLLAAAFFYEVKYSPGKVGLAVGVGHRDISDMLPGLVRQARDHLQHLEF